MGLVTDEQVESALGRQKETRKRLGQLLLEDGVVTQLDLTKALAQKFGVSFLDLTETRFDGAATAYIDEKLARRYGAVPVRFLDDNTLLVAMIDPQNLPAQEDLAIITGFPIQPAIASEEDVFGAIAKIYREKAEVGESADEIGTGIDEDAITDIRDATEEAPIVKLVNSVIAQSVDDAASDIHFEPQAKELMVRFRIDGVLHEIMSIPRRMQSGVISRLKIMADLDIAERRVPQDGRIGLMVGGKPIDMRVASLPTVYGEKIVMRLLDKSQRDARPRGPRLRREGAQALPASRSRKPYGAILVTGPTGSGKSTTLYAALNILNTPEKNIITVEDPVEYRLTGINQVQVNTERGHDVRRGAALDPALRPRHRDGRRDPRPRDGADRHRVGAHRPPRALHAAHQRRPGRAVAPHGDGHRAVPDRRRPSTACWRSVSCGGSARTCKEPYTATREMLRKNDFPPEVCDRDDVVLYRAKGCSRCNNTGYKGRLGLYEVMIVSEAIERLIVERKSADEIGRVAAAEGMMSLREDGLERVLLGMTTVEEIARVIV